MSDQRGFTLVEMLVALVVGGLLLAALSSVVAGLSRDLHRSDGKQAASQVETIAPALKSLLENTVVPDGDSKPVFADDHAQLTVTPPQALASAGPLHLELNVEKRGQGEALVATFQPREGQPLAHFISAPRVLAQGFKHIEISASSSPVGDARPLPALITISFGPLSGPPVEIVAEPRLSSDGACHFDPISMSCRA